MPLTAAIAEAQARGAKPFRLELQANEIAALRDAGELEPKPTEHDSCNGVFRGQKVYLVTRVSELLAQPNDALLALHLPICLEEDS